jgi:hypothetical protein
VSDGAGGHHFWKKDRLGGGRQFLVYARNQRREQRDARDLEVTMEEGYERTVQDNPP